MNILTPAQRELLDTAKQEFNSAIDLSFETASREDLDEVNSLKNSILNALDEFGSENFVVSCIGMLKAGKSTLVNLFARNKDASPTGFGFDTTLRPAFITYTTEEKGGIEIWIPSKSGKNNSISKDVLEEVFLCLRKVKEESQVKGASCQKWDLTEANLENALCKRKLEAHKNMLPEEPVMVVVRVPVEKSTTMFHDDKSLLSSEIVLLDTPGLDSGLSQWTQDKNLYSWIIDNSDLLLFLQSSVAPLNQKAADIIKDIRAENPKTPIWLVQNEIYAKPWLPQERIKEENQNQRKQAAAMFNRVYKEEAGSVKMYNANLGKAHSAYFDITLKPEDRSRLREESEFLSIEEYIRSDLQSSIGPIRMENCIENINKRTCEFSAWLDRMEDNIGKKKEQIENEIDVLNKFKTNYKDELDIACAKVEKSIEKGKVELIENHFDTFKYKKMLSDFIKHGLKKEIYSKTDLDSLLEEKQKELIEMIQNDISSITKNDFKFTVDGEDNSNIDHILDVFKECAHELRDSKEIEYKSFFSWEKAKDLIDAVASELTLPQMSESFTRDWESKSIVFNVSKNKYKLFWNLELPIVWKSRTAEEARDVLKKYCDPENKEGVFASLIEDAKETIKNKFAEWIQHVFKDKLCSEFKEEMDEKLEKQIKEAKHQNEAMERDCNSIRKKRKSCVALCKKIDIIKGAMM